MRKSWILTAALVCSSVFAQVRAEEKEPEVYSPADLMDACEYLLTQAVSCQPKIYFELGKGITSQDISKLLGLLVEYRFADCSYSVEQQGEDGEVLCITPNYKSCVRMLKFHRDKESIELTCKEKAAYEKATEILAELGVEGRTNTEKAKIIHDWIVANCRYDMAAYQRGASYRSQGADGYNAYDGKFMLLMRRGVCDSYAQAYWLLLQMSGVPSSMMSGSMLDGGGHAWNLVFLDDHWAHVDTTHDDPVPDVPDRICDDYFDKTDAEMEATRTWEKDFFPNADFTKLFSSDNEMVTLDQVSDVIDFVGNQRGDTDMEYTIEVLDLKERKDFDKNIQAAAEEAGLGRRVSSTQDPLFPDAIRVKFHKNKRR